MNDKPCPWSVVHYLIESLLTYKQTRYKIYKDKHELFTVIFTSHIYGSFCRR